MPVYEDEEPHRHVEHRHEDSRDHRKEKHCPGDEDVNTADDSGGNSPPPPPPKDDEPIGG